jgi:hypothetical protein
MYRHLILKFVYKFICILKAASHGLIVKYIGGNQFEFISHNNINIKKFFEKYKKKLPSFITTI